MKEILNASTAYTGQRQRRECRHCGECGDGRGGTCRLRHMQAGLLRPGRGSRVQFGEAAGRRDHPRPWRPYEGARRGPARAGEGGGASCGVRQRGGVRGLRAFAGCGSQRRRRVRALRRRRSARFGRPGRASLPHFPRCGRFLRVSVRRARKRLRLPRLHDRHRCRDRCGLGGAFRRAPAGSGEQPRCAHASDGPLSLRHQAAHRIGARASVQRPGARGPG